MVSGFTHDYMHLVCLGVVHCLLDLWVGTCGMLKSCISSTQVSLIPSKLLAVRMYIPSEFARKPRGIDERLRWKATELRQFLLYTGPVVLKDVLAPEVYQNFMLLSVSIYILASPTYCLMLCKDTPQSICQTLRGTLWSGICGLQHTWFDSPQWRRKDAWELGLNIQISFWELFKKRLKAWLESLVHHCNKFTSKYSKNWQKPENVVFRWTCTTRLYGNCLPI